MRWVLLLTLMTLYGADPPDWVIQGIIRVETESYFLDTEPVWVKHKRGTHGEIGMCQIRPIAFRQVRRPGESFWDMLDPHFSLEIATRYLVWLHRRRPDTRRAWMVTVQEYNAGPGNRSPQYLDRVLLNRVDS